MLPDQVSQGGSKKSSVLFFIADLLAVLYISALSSIQTGFFPPSSSTTANRFEIDRKSEFANISLFLILISNPNRREMLRSRLHNYSPDACATCEENQIIPFFILGSELEYREYAYRF